MIMMMIDGDDGDDEDDDKVMDLRAMLVRNLTAMPMVTTMAATR